MSREIDISKPLTKKDIEYLESRFSTAYVDRMKELAGVKGGKAAKDDAEEAPDAGSTAEDNGSGTDANEVAGNSGDGNDGDDLLGDLGFSPLDKTETEVKDYFATLEGDALEAEKERVFAIEKAREDREPRKGVLAL